MTNTEIIDVTNEFFRNKPMSIEELKELKKDYDSEWTMLNSGKGCSRCKKNSIRRKYSRKIKQILGRQES